MRETFYNVFCLSKVKEMDGFMEIVAALIDSFKGVWFPVQAGKAAKGIHKVDPEAKVHVRPLADDKDSGSVGVRYERNDTESFIT